MNEPTEFITECVLKIDEQYFNYFVFKSKNLCSFNGKIGKIRSILPYYKGIMLFEISKSELYTFKNIMPLISDKNIINKLMMLYEQYKTPNRDMAVIENEIHLQAVPESVLKEIKKLINQQHEKQTT